VGELHITIPGTIRIKKNSKRIFARGRFKTVLPSKAYENWERTAMISLKIDGDPIKGLLYCPVHVEAHFYYRGRRPDLSGCLESIGDCLQGFIWADDTLIESWDGSRLHHDLERPRTEVFVRW